MTQDDEITVARLEWLEAEARLAGLLPGEGGTGELASADPAVHANEVATAIENSVRTHGDYIAAVRRWAGLPGT